MNISDYKFIISIFAGWLVAQLIKSIINVSKAKNLSPAELLFRSGNMPSSHASTILSITTLIGWQETIYSPIFGLALAISLIVIYDAVKSRKAVGDQAEAINKLLKESNSKQSSVKVISGHTVLEMICGVILGVIVGTVVFFATK